MRAFSFTRSLEFYQPWVAARPEIFARLNGSPLDQAIDPANVFDPLRLSSASFLDMMHTLHTLVCGPFGMPMERWVGFDCGLVPGAYWGFGVPADSLNPALRAGLKVPEGYEGLVPFSLASAIPFPDRRNWECISMGSLNQVAPGAGLAGTTRLTLALGADLLRCDELWYVTRWRSRLLGIFSRMEPAELVTAWTPAHDYPSTVTFRIKPSSEGRERLLRGGRLRSGPVDTWIDADDTLAMQALQADIEAGLKVWVVGRSEDFGTEVRYPLHLEGEPSQFVGIDSFDHDHGVDYA